MLGRHVLLFFWGLYCIFSFLYVFPEMLWCVIGGSVAGVVALQSVESDDDGSNRLRIL